MPYKVLKSDSCPADKPWAVVTEGTGKVHGCHPSKEHAEQQLKALYVNAPPKDESSMPGYETRYFAGDIELRELIPDAAEPQGGATLPNASDMDPSMGAQGSNTGKKRADEFFPGQVRGTVARFGALSEDLGGFREKISREAFRNTLQSGDCRALVNHDSRLVLGRVSAGTLSLRETRDGLQCDIDLPDTTYARDLATSIRRRDITGMSFGFRVLRDDWEVGPQGENIRTLKEVELLDVSPVTYPAYQQTDVAMRSLQHFLSSRAEPTKDRSAVAADIETPAGVLEVIRMRRRLEEIRFTD